MVKRYLKPIDLLRLLTAILLLAPLMGGAQPYPGYPDSTIARLNTAASADYLSAAEKETVLLINLLRHNSKLFWETLAAPYIAEHEIAEDRYVKSLERDLHRTPRLKKLQPHRRLHQAASKHAQASGRSGTLGHTSSAGTFEQRLRPLADEFNFLLENCDYGSSEAIDIVMNLLIDRGVPDVGHRKNILHKDINTIGVSIAPHKSYQANCVQVFGQLRSAKGQ